MVLLVRAGWGERLGSFDWLRGRYGLCYGTQETIT